MGALPFIWFIMKGVRRRHLKICHLDIGLLCSEGEWETADAALRFQPGAGLQLPCESIGLLSAIPEREQPSSLGKERWHRDDSAQTNLRRRALIFQLFTLQIHLPAIPPLGAPTPSPVLITLHNLLPFVKMVWRNLSPFFVRPVCIQNKPLLCLLSVSFAGSSYWI